MVSAAARPIDSALSPPGWSTFELRTRSGVCPPPSVCPFSTVTAPSISIGSTNSNVDPTKKTSVRTYLKADPRVFPNSGSPQWSLSPGTPWASSQLSTPASGRLRASNRNSASNCSEFSTSSSSPTYSTSDPEHRRPFREMKCSTSSSSPARYSQNESLVSLVTSSKKLKVACSCRASLKSDSLNGTPARTVLIDSAQLPTENFETHSSVCQNRREVENQRVSRRSLLRSFSRNLSWFPFKTGHRSNSPSSPVANPRPRSKPTDLDVQAVFGAPPQLIEDPNPAAQRIPLSWNSKTSAVQPPPNRNPFSNQTTSPLPGR